MLPFVDNVDISRSKVLNVQSTLKLLRTSQENAEESIFRKYSNV